MIFPTLLAVMFYGVKFDPVMTNSPTASRVYPIRQGVYRMVQPDGEVKIFQITDEERGVLVADRPWVGVIRDRQLDIWADPEYTGGKLRTAYTFVGGVLRRAVLNGANYDFIKGPVRNGGLDSLFPKRTKRSYEKNSSADLWRNGDSRLRLWFASPNVAGILLAEFALLFLYLALKFRFRMVSVTLFLITSYGMFATGSRGALVGFLTGLLCLGVGYYRIVLSRRGMVCLGIVAAMFVGGLLLSGNLGRVANTFRAVDQGNSLRIKAARAAVQMFSDAPSGWSGGEVPSRNALLNWYVPDESRSLRTHLMSLTEIGWFKGYFYILFWVTVMAVGVWALTKGMPIIVMTWSAFAISGMFNPVYINWEVWVLPVATTVCFVDKRIRLSRSAGRIVCWCSAAVSLLITIGLIVAGNVIDRAHGIPVKSVGNATYVNGNEPRIWIVGDEITMGGGGFPGRDILRYYLKHPEAEPVAYAYDVEDLPESAEVVVLSGRSVGDYIRRYEAKQPVCKPGRLLMLSPSVGPSSVPDGLREASKVDMVAGNLLAIRDPSFGVKRPWIRIVPGCERYIPQWMEMVMSEIGPR